VKAAEIARALNLRRAGATYVGPCPACSYRGFEVRERSGMTLVHCHGGGCEQAVVLAALRGMALWRGERPVYPMRHRRKAKPAEPEHAQDLVRWLWQRARPASGSAVERYLRRRGYSRSVPPTVRLLPDAKHAETGTHWPAMIALVCRAGRVGPTAVHRTFPLPDGTDKAPVTPDKKTLGPVGGGAVPLGVAGGQLAITEGIETGLSVLGATGVPTWAALPLARKVTVCADHDPVGIAAAYDAAQRWHHEGRHVRIAVPSKPGADFNDLALAAEPTS
jgi:putative DNA primase/helicase